MRSVGAVVFTLREKNVVECHWRLNRKWAHREQDDSMTTSAAAIRCAVIYRLAGLQQPFNFFHPQISYRHPATQRPLGFARCVAVAVHGSSGQGCLG